jgi:hypothetical protein
MKSTFYFGKPLSSILILKYSSPGEGDKYDFVLIPTTAATTYTLVREEGRLVCQVSENDKRMFDAKNIPFVFETVVLPIRTCMVMDLKCLFITQGRGGHASNKCPFGPSLWSDWKLKACKCSPLHTIDSLQAEVRRNRETIGLNPDGDDDASDEESTVVVVTENEAVIAALEEEEDEEEEEEEVDVPDDVQPVTVDAAVPSSVKSGMGILRLLFPSIKDVSFPGLHMKLRLAGLICNAFFDFSSEHLDKDHPVLAEARLALETAVKRKKKAYAAQSSLKCPLQEDVKGIKVLDKLETAVATLEKKLAEQRSVEVKGAVATVEVKKGAVAIVTIDELVKKLATAKKSLESHNGKVADRFKPGTEKNKRLRNSIKSYTESRTTTNVAVATADAEVKRLRSIVNKHLESRQVLTVSRAQEDLLGDYGIYRNQHHNNCVDGNALTTLMRSRTELGKKLDEIYKDKTLRRAVPGKSDREIDSFLKGMSSLLEGLDAICNLVTSKVPLDDKQCTELENLCKAFGVTWREHLKSRPVYLHLVEEHLWEMMRTLRSMTHADEGAIERLHHLIAELTRRFKPVHGWAKRRTAIMRLQERVNSAAVVQATGEMLEGSKRKFATKVDTVKKEKKAKVIAVKEESVTKAAENAAAVLAAVPKNKRKK